jgi:DNA mismatch repair protein MSH3
MTGTDYHCVAFDELAKGRSTFMVEMTETSDILRSATSRSLVILDELGRGTSTFDGMAIADATLRYLVEEVKCKTLFITHYPLVATDIEKRFPDDVQNLHMGFTEEQRIDGTRDITFLYHLTPGIASGSFGVECGRLASIPESILERAAALAAIMQATVEERHHRSKLRKAMKLLKQCMNNVSMLSDDARISLGELKECVESISDGDTDAIVI